jgi:hypothetical protein
MRAMRWAAIATLIGLFWLPAQAGAQSDNDVAPKRQHPAARITVYPRSQSYPGPNAVRQCTSWIAPEYRPSGTVIVPKMHCWWERG